MGVVYFGIDSSLGRPVAVKVIRQRFANNQELIARFEAEARINAQLQHPGIVPVHQVGKLADGRSFYTMKRVRGETFADVLKRRVSPSTDLLITLGQFRRVCEAMAYAHAHNVLHRDLKPGNVMVGEYGEVLLMDWGLAKVMGAETTPEPTPEPASRTINLGLEGSDRDPTRGAVGTVPYMPPEQAAGHITEVDKRSDVFGLGAILCTILTGKPPYIGANDRFVERKALEGDLEEANHRLAKCGADAELVALTLKCLSPERVDRPADAGEVAKAMTAYLAGVEERLRQAEIQRKEIEVRMVERRKRRAVKQRLGSVIAILLAGCAYFAWWYDKRETNRQVEAETRLNRNAEALLRLVGACEDALRANDASRAQAALAEATERVTEGGGEVVANRLARCRMDLEILVDLDEIDLFRWTPTQHNYPEETVVADRWREAFKKFGVVSGSVPAEDSARRVNDSLVRYRLLGTLDLWLGIEPSPGLRAILGAADPHQYRETIRDAIVVGHINDVMELVRRPEALDQPVWFAAVLGQIPGVPVARRREVLQVALQGQPNGLTLLMSLGKSYPVNQREGAEERVRWFQAAVAAAPGNMAAHNALGVSLNDKGEPDGAVREYKFAFHLDPNHAWPRNNMGQALKNKGDLEGAIREFKIAITLDPKHAGSHNQLGRALSDKGDVDGAIEEFKIAITLDPKFPWPHFNLGVILSQKGDVEGAIREFKIAMGLDPKLADPHTSLGLILFAKGDVDAAIREFNIAIDLNSKHPVSRTSLGLALFAKGNVDDAIRELKIAIELDPKAAPLHIGLALVLFAKGDANGAIQEYKTAINLDPKLALPHTGLGNLLKDKGDVEGAIQEFQIASKLNPKDPWPHNDLGLVLKDKGDLDGAIREYKTAISLDPKLAKPHTNLGIALRDKGDVEGAIREYKTAIDLDPKYANPHNEMGLYLFSKGDVEGATREFKIATGLDLKDPWPHNNLGIALQTKGDSEGAMREFRAAIDLAPKLAKPHSGLGAVLKAKGDLEGAMREFRIATGLDPKLPLPHNELGLYLSSKGDQEGAIREFRIATGLDPKDPWPHNNLGLAFQKKGDPDGAIREFRSAIDLAPKLVNPHIGLGVALQSKGDVEGAIREFRFANGLNSKFALSYNNLAALLMKRGEPYAALQVLRDGIRVDQRFINDFRYNLACAAVLVANGQGKDTPAQVDQNGLRREALGWLTDELTLGQKLANNTKNNIVIYKTMLHWLADTDLSSVRDVDKLPAAEREAWSKFWAGVRKLRDNTAPRPVAPAPRLVK
jgi:tetratricopeptide (TPR) repeat protein